MRTRLRELYADPKDKIIDVIEIINKNILKHAFIVDKEKHLLGIVSDGDIRRGILNNVPLHTPIKKIMNKNPFIAKVGIPKAEILDILIKKKLLIVPILSNDKKVIGYYHITDFIKEEFLDNNLKNLNESFKEKKILITGGAGYIGSKLVEMLLDKGYNVRVLDKLVFGIEPLKKFLNNANFELVKGDYTKIEDLIPCLKNVNSVIHLAAIVGDPAGKIDPELTRETNYHGVKILGEFCKYYGIKKLIFASTCSVYGASNNEILTEKSELNPVSLYAETKLKAENALLELKSDKFHPCILRLSTVFGLSNRMRFDLVVNLLTALAVKNNEISIFSGKQWRPFVHVVDVGRAIMNILKQSHDVISGEIFNIGKEDNNHRIEELGFLIKKIFPKVKINRIDKKEDNRSYRVGFNKAKNVLNFHATYDLEYGIREIAKFIKNEGIDFKDSDFSNYKKVQMGVYDSLSFAE